MYGKIFGYKKVFEMVVFISQFAIEKSHSSCDCLKKDLFASVSSVKLNFSNITCGV